MPAQPSTKPFAVRNDGVLLGGEESGEGTPIVLLHGLTATRRYVVHGSRHLPKNGFRAIAYDARGHGASTPAPEPDDYRYAAQVDDLRAVLDDRGVERVALAGVSMGAATAAAFALEAPDRVSALVLITPGYAGEPKFHDLDQWDRLADGLERGGIDGFVEAWEPPRDERWREIAETVTRQRLERHEHLDAVAQALRVVPRSAAFHGLEALERVQAPTLVVGSRDEADPGHPLELARAYAEHLPRSMLVVEPEGKSPLAWQGAQLSRSIEDFVRHVGG
jgi:3-oxoadipate enol-lactonase